MTESPLVSVIIPCYNAEKYVEQAVRSIMTQTYKNLEILITDDCSTDSSFAILQKLAKEDSRIKLFKNEQNQKIVRTLNTLVERANGKYIARMDADDISLQKRIEKQVEFMEANPDIAICGTNAWHIDEANRVISKSHLPIYNSEIQLFKNFANPFYHPSVVIRSSVLKECLYDEKFLLAEDYDLWIRILAKRKGSNLRNRFLYYRILQSSLSHDSQTKKKQQKISEQVHALRDFKLLGKMNNPLLVGQILYYGLKNKEYTVRQIISFKKFYSIVVFIIFESVQRYFLHGRKINA